MFNLPHLMYLLRARMAVSLVRTSLHDSWGMSLLYRHPRVDNKVNKDTKVDPKEPQLPLEVCVASLVEGAPASHLLRPGDIIRYGEERNVKNLHGLCLAIPIDIH